MVHSPLKWKSSQHTRTRTHAHCGTFYSIVSLFSKIEIYIVAVFGVGGVGGAAREWAELSVFLGICFHRIFGASERAKEREKKRANRVHQITFSNARKVANFTIVMWMVIAESNLLLICYLYNNDAK